MRYTQLLPQIALLLCVAEGCELGLGLEDTKQAGETAGDASVEANAGAGGIADGSGGYGGLPSDSASPEDASVHPDAGLPRTQARIAAQDTICRMVCASPTSATRARSKPATRTTAPERRFAIPPARPGAPATTLRAATLDTVSRVASAPAEEVAVLV